MFRQGISNMMDLRWPQSTLLLDAQSKTSILTASAQSSLLLRGYVCFEFYGLEAATMATRWERCVGEGCAENCNPRVR